MADEAPGPPPQNQPNIAGDPAGQPSGPIGVVIQPSEKAMDDKTGRPRGKSLEEEQTPPPKGDADASQDMPAPL